jgi:beta-glucanase (GH16 family)
MTRHAVQQPGAPPAAPGRRSAPRRLFGKRRRGPRRPWLLPSLLAVIVLAGGVVTFVVSNQRGGTPPEVPAPQGPSGSWSLAWHDEFNGTSLDRHKWQPNRSGESSGDAPFQNSDEAAWFSPSNVTVADSNLTLTLQRGSKDFGDTTYPYRTGVAETTPSFLVKPGAYVEARIKVPECDGCWPAFWLVPHDQWPPEIDIFEFFGTHHDQRPSFNYHPPDGGQTGPKHYGPKGTDYRNTFHVYGLEWDGDQAIPYVDGQAFPGVAATENMTSLPLMMILNLSVQAGHEPSPGAQMQVDWVRVWRPQQQ